MLLVAVVCQLAKGVGVIGDGESLTCLIMEKIYFILFCVQLDLANAGFAVDTSSRSNFTHSCKRHNSGTSLGKGGKRIRKLERKTITMRSPARTTATFGGLKIQNLPNDEN